MSPNNYGVAFEDSKSVAGSFVPHLNSHTVSLESLNLGFQDITQLNLSRLGHCGDPGSVAEDC